MTDVEVHFSEMQWGSDDAKEDVDLETFFVEFPGYDKVISGEKRYVIGRKGTGKTAILKKTEMDCEKKPLSFSANVTLREFPLADFKKMGDRSFESKSKYVPAWTFVLLIELIGLMMRDNSINGSEEMTKLEDIVRINFPEGISATETIRKVRSNKNKITFSHGPFSGEKSKHSSIEIESSIHYQQAVKEIQALLRDIESESTFYLLIDELDEGYQSANRNYDLVILSLLRATEDLHQFFMSTGLRCIPIVALRSDIFGSLRDNDLNKLDDYLLHLKWTSRVESPWSIKRIVESRVNASIVKKYPNSEGLNDDLWALIAEEGSVKGGLWPLVCNLTLDRPRDIVKLMKKCKEYSPQKGKLSLKILQDADPDFSSWLSKEIRDEIQSILPCWEEAFNCLTEVGKYKGETESLVRCIESNGIISAWLKKMKKEPMDVVKIFFEYSVIGCLNRESRWIFKYKDDSLRFMSSYPRYCVHFGLCKKLRLHKKLDGMHAQR